MPPHDPPRADWRAWLALAWAFAFGLAYTRTVVGHRVGRLVSSVARPAAGPAKPSPPPPPRTTVSPSTDR